MGLFDAIAGQVVGQIANAVTGQSSSKAGGLDIMSLVGGLLNNPQTGGLQGLVSAFQSNGLGDVVASWIGKGANLPISAEQIQAALGSGPLQALAEKVGVSPEMVSSQLAQFLPGVVDQLTPNGELPKGDLMSQGLGLLQGLMSNKG